MNEGFNFDSVENLPREASAPLTPEELAILEKKYAVGIQASEIIPEPQSKGDENQTEADLGNGKTKVGTNEHLQGGYGDVLTAYSLSATERAQINIEAVADRITYSRESIARLEVRIHELDLEIEEMKDSLLKRIISFRSIALKERFKVSMQ